MVRVHLHPLVVKCDREIPAGPFAIGVRRAEQTITEPVDLETVMPSDWGVLLETPTGFFP